MHYSQNNLPNDLPDEIYTTLQKRLGDRMQSYRFPPPVFLAMQGEFVHFDPQQARLTTRFPILEQYLNPYGAMQGGMIAAAVDNSLGPLSVLVAPPNVTRHLVMTYSHPIVMEMKTISVTSTLLQREGRWLSFSADVHDPTGIRLARAKATHWIIEDIPDLAGE